MSTAAPGADRKPQFNHARDVSHAVGTGGVSVPARGMDVREMSSRPRKRVEKVIELLEIDGKKVSKTATGKRKFHNKSKNGCDNCKRRRVKCDEEKPCCQKCLKMKLSCVYTPARPRKKNKDVETVIKYVTKKLDQGEGNGLASMSATSAVLQPDSVADNSKEKHEPVSNTNADPLVIPSLLAGVNAPQLQLQIQQQPNILPHLMTLSASEKFANFELPNSPIPAQGGSTGVHSMSAVLSNNKFSTNLTQQIVQSPTQLDLNLNLSKNGVSLKQFGGTFSTAGISGVTYDFQELLGIKSTTKEQEPLPQQHDAGNTPALTATMMTREPVEPGASLGPGTSVRKRSQQPLKQHQGPAQRSQLPQGQRKEPRKDILITRRQSPHDNSAAAVLATLNVRAPASAVMQDAGMSSIALTMSPLSKTEANKLAVESKVCISDGTASDAETRSHGIVTGPEVISKSKSCCGAASPGVLDECEADSPSSTYSSTGILSFAKIVEFTENSSLNLVDLRLFHHYCTRVWPTIVSAGMSEQRIWSEHIPELAFRYPFLMHALLAFSATHLSRSQSGLEPYVASHRLESLKLLREAVLQIREENTDALVASALILIMDSLANASTPASPISTCSISPSAWIFHVKGAATILTAVWPLTPNSKFYNLINVDLSDLGDIINSENGTVTDLVCFDNSISDLYPVEIDSPYLITLAYLDKLYREKNRSGFILRIFAFPALLDKTFLALLMTGDLGAMRIMRSYYKLLHGYATEVKDEVWFLEGMSSVLPQDVDEYSGGGGMHMMLDFLGGGLPSMTTTNFTEFVYNE